MKKELKRRQQREKLKPCGRSKKKMSERRPQDEE
jgi:hypothetical protein